MIRAFWGSGDPVTHMGSWLCSGKNLKTSQHVESEFISEAVKQRGATPQSELPPPSGIYFSYLRLIQWRDRAFNKGEEYSGLSQKGVETGKGWRLLRRGPLAMLCPYPDFSFLFLGAQSVLFSTLMYYNECVMAKGYFEGK